MSQIPVLKLGDYLIVSIQSDIHDKLALNLQDDITSKIKDTNAKGVLIDISSLKIVDSFTARIMGDISDMADILDAESVLVGMQPAVAITLVELGISLSKINTALNIDKGMDLLQKLVESTGQEKNDETSKRFSKNYSDND